MSLDQRKLAVESIGFIDDARAANVMLELASDGSPVKGEAFAWLLRNLAGEWGKHDIGAGLKEKGIYDPEAIKVSASPVPVPPANSKLPPVSDILELKGHERLMSLGCLFGFSWIHHHCFLVVERSGMNRLRPTRGDSSPHLPDAHSI